VEVEDSQQGEDSLSPTPETQVESLIVCETPTRAGTKRPPSSQDMTVCERPIKVGTKHPRFSDGMLPPYETLFGDETAATSYVTQKKKKKRCYGKKPTSHYC
jgi:hypothetical protein